MVIDSHTHSMFSHDSRISPEAMARAAIDKGLEYLAFTDHCDRDCLVAGMDWTQINLPQYVTDISCLKEKYKDKIYIALGLEVGYDRRASGHYIKDLSFCDFDVVINSVHLVGLEDIYLKQYFEGKTKRYAYESYLNAVYESLSAPYDYDIVGHLGYVMRNAQYEDRRLIYEEYREIIDKILLKIIETDKTLEINSAVKTLPLLCLPDMDILARYKELGGNNITFGSDAHQQERLAQNYDLICERARGLGFAHWTIYKGRIPYKIII